MPEQRVWTLGSEEDQRRMRREVGSRLWQSRSQKRLRARVWRWAPEETQGSALLPSQTWPTIRIFRKLYGTVKRYSSAINSCFNFGWKQLIYIFHTILENKIKVFTLRTLDKLNQWNFTERQGAEYLNMFNIYCMLCVLCTYLHQSTTDI